MLASGTSEAPIGFVAPLMIRAHDDPLVALALQQWMRPMTAYVIERMQFSTRISDDEYALIGRQRFRASHCPDAPFVFVDYEGCRIGSIKRSFSTACRRAGISDFRIHDLRHTFASWLVTEGVPLLEVSRLLGHSTVKMTERYAHLAPDSLESAVSLLDQRSHSSHTDRGQKRRRVVSH